VKALYRRPDVPRLTLTNNFRIARLDPFAELQLSAERARPTGRLSSAYAVTRTRPGSLARPIAVISHNGTSGDLFPPAERRRRWFLYFCYEMVSGTTPKSKGRMNAIRLFL
jgi:hypothetical protein